jgi:hypothetical protein
MTFEPVLFTDSDMVEFLDILTDVDHKGLTVVQICKRFKISTTTFYRKLENLELQGRIKRRRKLKAIAKSSEIDEALYKKCLTGNPEAIKLWLEYFEGWIPRQGIVQEIDGEESEEDKLRRIELMNYIKSLKDPKEPAQEPIDVPIVIEVETNGKVEGIVEGAPIEPLEPTIEPKEPEANPL